MNIKMSPEMITALVPFIGPATELALTAVQIAALWNAGVTTEQMAGAAMEAKRNAHDHATNSQLTTAERAQVEATGQEVRS